MVTYLFDSTFEGFLTAVYEAYYRRESPDEITPEGEYIPNFLTKAVMIPTDESKAQRVSEAIENKISKEAARNIFYAYLSDLPGSCTFAYHYILLGFKVGSLVDHHLHETAVLHVHKIRNKVNLEVQRLVGFIRFAAIGKSLYYAVIEPDHNILGLITPHFTNRLSNENWIIHDTKRRLAALYNTEEWIITSLNKELSFSIGEDERFYQTLWKEYFETAAVTSRINTRLQKRLMPIRYWKHLLETQKENSPSNKG